MADSPQALRSLMEDHSLRGQPSLSTYTYTSEHYDTVFSIRQGILMLWPIIVFCD